MKASAFERDPNLNPEHLQFTKAMAEASAVLDAPGPLFGDAPMRVLSGEYTYLGWNGMPPGSTKCSAGSARWPEVAGRGVDGRIVWGRD